MSTRQIDAKFPGTCSCGATVGPEDRVDFDDETKKIVCCIMCGLKDTRYQGPRKGVRVSPHAWKYSPGSNPNQDRRSTAHEIARLQIFAARYEAAGKVTMAASRRQDLATALADAQKLSPRWARPTARDIELAGEKIEADLKRRVAEEEEV
jgi:hypothetical protein